VQKVVRVFEIISATQAKELDSALQSGTAKEKTAAPTKK
jgi:hypothetical protein